MCIRDSVWFGGIQAIGGTMTAGTIIAFVNYLRQALMSLMICLLYTSDAADALLCVDLGGRRLIQKKIRYPMM